MRIMRRTKMTSSNATAAYCKYCQPSHNCALGVMRARSREINHAQISNPLAIIASVSHIAISFFMGEVYAFSSLTLLSSRFLASMAAWILALFFSRNLSILLSSRRKKSAHHVLVESGGIWLGNSPALGAFFIVKVYAIFRDIEYSIFLKKSQLKGTPCLLVHHFTRR